MQDFIPVRKDINGYIDDVTVKQFDNDSRFLHVTISDDDLSDGDSFNMQGCTARLLVELGAENYEYIDGEIADAEGGIVTFLLPGSVTQTAGTYKCEIRITEPESGALISTKPFSLKVEKSINADGAIEATPQYSALENALMKVDRNDRRMNELAAMADAGDIPAGTVEAEVTDARIGKGQTYSSAGDAVRAAVQGISGYLNAAGWASAPYSNDFDNLPNNIIIPCGIDNTGGTVDHAPVTNGAMTGLILTLGRGTERKNGDVQLWIPCHGDTMKYRQYNVTDGAGSAAAWSAWVRGTESIEQIINTMQSGMDALPQYRASINGAHADYENMISHYTRDGTFFANVGNWGDLPTSAESYIISNSRYSNYVLQTAVSIANGTVYNRIVHKDNFTVFRDWEVPDSLDRRLKVLAVGDSICYGARNENKGFVGDLGLQVTNKSIVGIRISERNNSSNPATRDVDTADRNFYRPSIPRLFDYMTGHEIIPDRSVFPSDMRFNGNVITSLSDIPLPSGYYPDIIIVDGGVNDYAYNAELGSVPTAPVMDDTAAGNLDRQTVMGALQYLFYRMVQEFPAAQRFFLIPHKIFSNGVYWVTTPNAQGYTQQQLHDAIVTCCKVYNVKVIDVFEDSLINSLFPEYRSAIPYSENNALTDEEYIDADGIHPMALGYKEGYIPLVREAIRIGTVKGG